jgi:hypothetical protein
MTQGKAEEGKRPAWRHRLTEDVVRWLAQGGVKKIAHGWKMTGVDTADYWIDLHRETDSRRFSTDFLTTNGYFEFRPNWRELVVSTPLGDQAVKDLEKIDEWERQNAADRVEFERLKQKFQDR